MNHLPFFIPASFIATALLTGFLLYKASGYSRILLIVAIAWLALQSALSLSGFYQTTTGVPPRFMLLIVPPVLAIILLFVSPKGRQFFDQFNIKTLTLLHVIRLPLELILLALYYQHAVPQVMTFEGRNLDVLSGLTAPLVYYFGYIKNTIGLKALLAWNIVCLLLLFNIVSTAVLSAPLAFQKFGFEQPNIALFYFPFSWLPCFVVPAVLLAHVVSIRGLMRKG